MTTADEFEQMLRQHVIDPWFPRSLDRENGGFFCDYDRAWKPAGPQERLLEFQARHTLAAADFSRAFPDDAMLREATAHGFRYLRDVLWDKEEGGWFHLVDAKGKPLESLTKHAHGFAYAIGACASVYAATGDRSALELGQEAFAWIERHAHDKEHGGYFGFLTRDGKAIRRPSDAPYKTELDTVGTEIGLKDLNVQSDLLETLALLYRVWPDPLLRTRLDEMVDIVSDKMVVPSTGAMHFFVTADWRPLPHLIRVGYQCHSAYRLLLALSVTADSERVRGVARRIVDSAVRYALDTEVGGFFYATPGVLPNVLHEHDVRSRRKAWWVQCEALRALCAMSRTVPDDGRYLQLFERQWRYMKRHCFDPRFGGMYSFGLDTAARWQRKMGARLAPAWMTRKGDVWKDASHEGRAMLFCRDMLRGGSL